MIAYNLLQSVELLGNQSRQRRVNPLTHFSARGDDRDSFLVDDDVRRQADLSGLEVDRFGKPGGQAELSVADGYAPSQSEGAKQEHPSSRHGVGRRAPTIRGSRRRISPRL